MTSLYLCLIEHRRFVYVFDVVDLLCGDRLYGLGDVLDLEHINGRWLVSGVCQQSLVILGPVFLGLLEGESRLDLGHWSRGLLIFPPVLAVYRLGEFRQLLSMNSNCHISKLGGVV